MWTLLGKKDKSSKGTILYLSSNVDSIGKVHLDLGNTMRHEIDMKTSKWSVETQRLCIPFNLKWQNVKIMKCNTSATIMAHLNCEQFHT